VIQDHNQTRLFIEKDAQALFHRSRHLGSVFRPDQVVEQAAYLADLPDAVDQVRRGFPVGFPIFFRIPVKGVPGVLGDLDAELTGQFLDPFFHSIV
jgi:hypothetical protein